jgi:hypothetical protein
MAANPGDCLVSRYDRTPLSHLVLGLTLAVVISGETAMPGDIAPDPSPHHVALVGGSWFGAGERIVRPLGILDAFR